MVPLSSLILIAIMTMRVLAMAAGALVLFDSHRVITGETERPPHNARRNAWAWAFIGGGCLIGSASFLCFGFAYYAPGSGGLTEDAAVLAIWTGLAIGLIQRAAARAENPSNTYLSIAIFAFGAIMLAGLDR